MASSTRKRLAGHSFRDCYCPYRCYEVVRFRRPRFLDPILYGDWLYLCQIDTPRIDFLPGMSLTDDDDDGGLVDLLMALQLD